MPSIELGELPPGPVTHALVIGVSRYPNADGSNATEFGESCGLENLSSAARSASEFTAWLLNEYRNPDAPLGSLHALFSPAEGEELHADVAGRIPAPFEATRAAVQRDLVEFLELCRNPDDVAIVYVAGHGVQLTKRGAIVLLEDFAGAGQLNKLEGAIDLAGCHSGLNGDGMARNQFWFVDACRQRPNFARKFESMAGALTLDQPVGQVESSPLFLASSTRESAFAEIGGTSLFSQAVLDSLRGDGARGPRDTEGEWTVPVSRLVELLNPKVKLLAGDYGEEQRVDITGRVNEADIHCFDGEPKVRIRLSLVPEAAATSVRAELLFGGETPIGPPLVEWPLDRRVPAGLYVIKVNSDDPYDDVMKPLDVRPLEYRDEVRVQR